MPRRRDRPLLFIVAPLLTGLILASPARAQGGGDPSARLQSSAPLVEVAAAFSINFPHCDGFQPNRCRYSASDTRNPPGGGWTVSGTGRVHDSLAITGEVGRYAQRTFCHGSSECLATTAPTAGCASTSGCPTWSPVRSFLTGPRFYTSEFVATDDRLSPVMRLFGQVLVGAVLNDVFPGGLAIQPGGGVNIGSATIPAAFRLEVDHTFVRGQPSLTGLRILGGVVLRFGSRTP